MNNIFGDVVDNSNNEDLNVGGKENKERNPFDYLKDGENILWENEHLLKSYQKYLIFKALSMSQTSILWANDINKFLHSIDNRIFQDYVVHIPKGYSKWAKRDKRKFELTRKIFDAIIENGMAIGTRDANAIIETMEKDCA